MSSLNFPNSKIPRSTVLKVYIITRECLLNGPRRTYYCITAKTKTMKFLSLMQIRTFLYRCLGFSVDVLDKKTLFLRRLQFLFYFILGLKTKNNIEYQNEKKTKKWPQMKVALKKVFNVCTYLNFQSNFYGLKDF